MLFRSLALVLLGTLVLAGCKADRYLNENQAPAMSATFEPQEAAYVKNLGTATVRGQASYTNGSTTYYPSNLRMMLIPVTAYSSEYIGHLFQGRAYYDTIREVENVDPRFTEYMRYAPTDDTGNFVFYGIPAGDYFLYTAMADSAGHAYGVFRRIAVTGGETIDVTVDGT